MGLKEYNEAKESMEVYQAYIKNIDQDTWLKEEENGEVKHTKNEEEMLVFYDDEDAESTLEYLNDSFSDSYVLLIEDDREKLHYQDEDE
ncbi:hypothetical protein IMZ31_19290 (plasmid) [Pontibacillus sp. ALD_SL1]|uniref:hypothetical protein n=1 Tax=Pontibacillus sp. ALD_SL1 TaxID=2777185 RepID=UPI001A9615FC|nr:hypothetical protein [Pontibacillus sp. ALD_SL1]QST02695.1 hypothetical protein IMZ31_19290 [Pontibacillus sp. ALD_SL1]